MLIDFENIGYVKCDNILLPTVSSYIPASTWGFIKGDITEQKDLIDLITNLEIGLTPEQIQMLSNAEIRLDNLENILETLDTETITNTLNGVKIELNRKAYKDEVYTKSEIDNKGYLTEHQSLADYYNKSEVEDLINNIEINGVDLSSYATKQWVEDKNYLTEHQSLADYATTEWVSTQLNGYITTEQLTDNVYNKSEIDNIISNIEIGDFDLTDYVTKDYLAEQNFATEQFVVNQGYIDIYTNRLINYYTKSEIDDKSYLTQDNLQDYVTYRTDRLSNYYKKTDVYTKSEIESKGYLTEHQSLADYYNKSEIDDIVNNIDVDLTGYATENWVTEQGYLTEHQSLDNYYTIEQTEELVFGEIDSVYAEIENLAGATIIDCDSFENIDWKTIADICQIPSQRYVIRVGGSDGNGLGSSGDMYNVIQTYASDATGFLKEYILILSNLASNQTVKITAKAKNVTVEYIDIATENWVTEQGYLTEHQSLDNYYNKSETDNLLSNKLDTNLIWSGTQSDWDNLSTEQQASYIIAMIEI